jgi:hypothetical protein
VLGAGIIKSILVSILKELEVMAPIMYSRKRKREKKRKNPVSKNKKGM